MSIFFTKKHKIIAILPLTTCKTECILCDIKGIGAAEGKLCLPMPVLFIIILKG